MFATYEPEQIDEVEGIILSGDIIAVRKGSPFACQSRMPGPARFDTEKTIPI